MKIFWRTIVFLILVGVVSIVPFFLSSAQLSAWGYALQGIGALASLLTFFIAIILFNKFGIEKSIIQKHTDAVIALLEFLRKESFPMEIIQLDAKLKIDHSIVRKINFSPVKSFKDIESDLVDYKDFTLIFGKSYLEKLNQLEKLINNLFVPKSIVERFQKLRFRYATVPLREATIQYILVTGREKISVRTLFREFEKTADPDWDSDEFNNAFEAFRKNQKLEDDKQWDDYPENPSLMNGEILTLQDFAKQWDSLMREINVWLKKNSNFPIDLNI
jgi:hypothetical protein